MNNKKLSVENPVWNDALFLPMGLISPPNIKLISLIPTMFYP